MRAKASLLLLIVLGLVACEEHQPEIPEAVAVPEEEVPEVAEESTIPVEVAEDAAEEATEDATGDVEEEKATAGEHLDRAIDATGRGLKTAGEKTAHGVGVAAEKTGEALQTAGEKTEEGVKKGAAATGRFLKKVGEKLEGAATGYEEEE